MTRKRILLALACQCLATCAGAQEPVAPPAEEQQQAPLATEPAAQELTPVTPETSAPSVQNDPPPAAGIPRETKAAPSLPDVEVSQPPDEASPAETGVKQLATPPDSGDVPVSPPPPRPSSKKVKKTGVAKVKPAKTSNPKAAAAPGKPAKPISEAGSQEDSPPAPVSPQPETPDIDISEQLPGALIVKDMDLSAVTATRGTDLVRNQGQTISETLSRKPGVAASTFAPGASRPILRGLDNSRVRIQEGGIGSHDASTLSEDHAVPIDPFAAERIEVIHGPATLRYGGDAVGGVVSVENDRIPALLPRNGFTAALLGGWSSVDDGRDGGFKITAGTGGVAVHLDAFARRAGDYDTPIGVELNSFVDSKGGAVGASLVGDNGYVGAAYVRVESRYGIPGEDVAIDLEQDKVLSRGEWRIGNHGLSALRFWFGASDYAHDEVNAEGEIGSRFTNREQEFRAEIEQARTSTTLGKHTSTMGVHLGHGEIRGQSFEGSSLLESAETRRIAGYLFHSIDLTRQIKALGAVRVDHARLDGTGLLDFSDPANLVIFSGEKSFTPVSVSAGLGYTFPNGIAARVTVQHIERAPQAAELFSQGLHEATGTFEIGNPNLEKEKARTVEFGLSKASGDLRVDASLYHTRFDGFIFRGLTGIGCGDTIDTCGVEDELDQVLFAQRDARFYGAEIAVQYDIAPIWNGIWGVDAQYDFVNARFDNGENVPRIPPHRLGGGMYYRDAAWYARIGLLQAFDQDRIGANETPTEGYTLLSAELSYTSRFGADGLAQELTVGVKGDNLADDEVRNHASFKKDDVLQPGASIRVFGTWKFN